MNINTSYPQKFTTDIILPEIIVSKIAYCGPDSSLTIKFDIDIKELEEKERIFKFNRGLK